MGEYMHAAATRSGWPGILLIWVISIAGAISAVALAYSGTTDWFGDTTRLGVYGALGVVFAASVVGALALQLASRRPEGFVARTSASVGGATVVVALAAVAVAPVVSG
jgi:hypothetical protein